MTRPKNKTLATWLTFLGGPLGLHRFYLKGFGDLLGWMLPIPTALGLYGVERVQRFGQDDQWSWLLIPMLGFTIAACALMAIIYGLMTPEKWNARFNPQLDPEAAPMYAQMLVGMIAMTGQWWLDSRRFTKHEVAAHVVNLAWNGLTDLERRPALSEPTLD